MELMAVAESYSLLWPDTFEDRYRGESYADVRDPVTGKTRRTGLYVVDLDAPLERDEFCVGQLHKLRPLTDDERKTIKASTPIDEPFARAKVARAQAGVTSGARIVPQASSPAVADVTDDGAEDASDDIARIPDPHVPQRKPAAQAAAKR